MSLPINVDAYSGYRANERPRSFSVDDTDCEIAEVEDQWRTPEALFFRVRTIEGKRYVLRYDEQSHKWALESDLDGIELFARPSIELISVSASAVRQAERQVIGCEQCYPDADIP